MIAFITLTNTGYIDYTLNCLKSLKNINFDHELHCYCIGKAGKEILETQGYKCTLIEDEKNSNFQKFREGNWADIVFNKFNIIHENLLKNDYVCFTDGDIVYENPEFMNYLLENIGENDILIQNDAMADNSFSNLCSGFMFIKSNPTTLNLFDPKIAETKKKQWENNQKFIWGDQEYINEIKKNLKFDTCPLKLFPNGKYYYNNASTITPYLIHFNWVSGHQKKQKMLSYKKWYI